MKTNDIIQNIDNFEDEYIVVGVSAGPDSMALLHIIMHNTNKKIVCVHINHNLRKESNNEEEYLKNYCQKNNIIFESIKINRYTEKNLENEARKKRYAFYETILKKYHSKYLFLAHHGDDLVETVIMKILRGSNLEGYAGIKTFSKQKNYIIVRPLLAYTKEEIIEYNKKNNITFFIDKTNSEETYTRNRFRKYILPPLKKEDKLAHIKFLDYSKKLQEYYNYIEDITKEKIENNYKNNTIDINKFQKEHSFIQKNIIFYMLSNIYDNQANIIKDKHIESIIKLITSNKANAYINLPKDYVAKKNYQSLVIDKKKEKTQDYKIELKSTNKINNLIIKKVSQTNIDGNNVCRLNLNNIKLPLYLRNKKNGDCVSVLGLDGHKKVKDIFIEEKIPLDKRKQYPLLVDSNDTILWIPNIKKSKYNVKKSESCDIILTSYEESEDFNEAKEKSQ